MPVTCCRMASRMPTISGSRSVRENSSAQLPFRADSAARMLASSALAKSSPATLVRIVLACSARPISTSHRGLSGIPSSNRANATEGRMPLANIQRQPTASFHARSPQPGDEVIHEIDDKDAPDDGDLVDRDQAAAQMRRGDFGDVHGRGHGGDADADAAEPAEQDEGPDVPRAAPCRWQTRGRAVPPAAGLSCARTCLRWGRRSARPSRSRSARSRRPSLSSPRPGGSARSGTQWPRR